MHAVEILQRGHLAVMDAIEDLTEEEWLAPEVCGRWSAKDIMAHLASYERALVEALRSARGEPPGGYLTGLIRDGELFNETQVALRVGYSAVEVVAQYAEAHVQAMDLAAALPPSLYINSGFLPAYGMGYDLEDFIVYMLYGHKKEHAAQIKVFRERLGK